MPEARRRLAVAAIAVTLVSGLAAGCGGSGPVPADAAARVGGETISYGGFEEYLSNEVGLDAVSSSRVLSGLLDQYLDELLLRRMAVDQGLVTGDEPGWQVVEALLAASRGEEVSRQEVVAYYRAHRERFARPERVVLLQVLADRRQEAEEIVAELRAGVTFEELAATLPGETVSASRGEVTREDLPAAFVDSIFALGEGEVSEVITADYGFHVFQVVEKLPAQEKTLEEATPEIVALLGREERLHRLEQLVTNARARYNVRVYARNLPFNYEGRYDASENSAR